MLCASACGDWIPFLFIYAGVLRHFKWLNGAMEGSACAMSDSSYINGKIFLAWLMFFNGHIDKEGIKRPVLLVLDGHFSHLSVDVLKYAISKEIGIFTLPSQTSHFTQPNDDVIFQTLKAGFAKEVSAFPNENDSRRPVRDDLARLISTAFEKNLKPSMIVKAFENTGIWPLNLNKMLARCIDEKPFSPKTPHINAVLPPTLSDRDCRRLEREGLSPQTARVVVLGLQMASSQLATKKRDANSRPFIKGGVLMTAPEMIKAYEDAKRKKEAEAEELEQRKKRRLEAAFEKKALAEEKQLASHELSLMKAEDKLSKLIRDQETPPKVRRRASRKSKSPLQISSTQESLKPPRQPPNKKDSGARQLPQIKHNAVRSEELGIHEEAVV